MENRFSKFTILISNIHKHITRIKSEVMSRFNLKSVHVSCLFYLYSCGDGITATQLSSLCEEDKSGLSRSLEYLQDMGYVDCENIGENKKYRAKLSLTEQGRAIGEQVVLATDKAVYEASRGISDGERNILYKCLNIISNNLKNINENIGE